MPRFLSSIVDALRAVFVPPHLRMTAEDRETQLRKIAVYTLARLGCDPGAVHDLMYVIDKEDFWSQYLDAHDALVKQYAEAAELAEKFKDVQPLMQMSTVHATGIQMVLAH